MGRGRERPPACKIAFSSSPSASGREILIGSLTVNVNQNLSAEYFSHDGWRGDVVEECVFVYLDSINVLRNANGKISLKEEQTLVVQEMLFGSSCLPEMFLLFFLLAI